MALTFDTANLIVESTASITDLPAFHAALRDWEDSEEAAVYPVTHKWKALNLGGGAFFYQADGINGWQLKFPNPGSYTIIGNLNMTIVPVAGVYVERKTSAAYITTAIGGSGPSAEQIAAATLAAAQVAPIHSSPQGPVLDLAKINGLVPGIDAVVTATSRAAGDVAQTISEADGAVTVARQ